MKVAQLADLYPLAAQQLLTAGGKELVTRLGVDAVKSVILAVLKGENLRNETERLTRRKIAISTGALTMFFLRGMAKDPSFLASLPNKAFVARKSGRLSKQQRWVLNWMLGLTDKGVQNVLRDDMHAGAAYVSEYTKALADAVAQFEKDYGSVHGTLELKTGNSEKVSTAIDWNFLVQFLSAAGTQALTIRGSDKSTYGKLFERLILGSVLHSLGFTQIDPVESPDRMKMVFWLSQRENKRESDATALIEPGRGIRFDIGFIGRGNSEISLDKVSRFEREMEFGRRHHTMATFIVVDRIGTRSRLAELAKRIDGTIIQMSMSYWPRELARHLSAIKGFHHPMTSMSDEEVEQYLAESLSRAPIQDFIPDHFADDDAPDTEDEASDD